MSTTTISEYKKPLHRRDNSGELDVFEAARYFSGYNENNVLVGEEKVIKQGKQGKLRPRGGSLDIPSFKQSHQYYYKEYHQNYTLARLEKHHENPPQQPPPPPQQQPQQRQQQIMKENKKFKQPSSPGGKLAQFLNSIFNQSITSKKKKLPKTTLSMKDEDESPSGRRLRRSSISHFRSTSSVGDEKSYYSTSSISGFQTPKITPYTINTPTKVYQNVKSFQDYKQVLATLSKYKIQEKELAKISKDAKVTKGGDYSNNRRSYEEIKKINEDKMDDYEDVESDASSDLFELQIDDEFTFCSSGLPVYESTQMDNMKRTSAIAK